MNRLTLSCVVQQNAAMEEFQTAIEIFAVYDGYGHALLVLKNV